MKMNKQSYRAIALLLLIVAASASYAQSGVKYPYVLNGRIIVSRDARGGAKTDCLHENWTSTPGHRYNEPENSVAWKFEVENVDIVGTNSFDEMECSDGWRAPTQRELLLMYVVKDQLTHSPFAFTPSGDNFLMSGTKMNSAVLFCYYTKSRIFGVTSESPIISQARLRCIRDLD